MMHFSYAAVFLGGFNAGIADSNGAKNTGTLGCAYFGCGSNVCCGCNRKLYVGVDGTSREIVAQPMTNSNENNVKITIAFFMFPPFFVTASGWVIIFNLYTCFMRQIKEESKIMIYYRSKNLGNQQVFRKISNATKHAHSLIAVEILSPLISGSGFNFLHGHQ